MSTHGISREGVEGNAEGVVRSEAQDGTPATPDGEERTGTPKPDPSLEAPVSRGVVEAGARLMERAKKVAGDINDAQLDDLSEDFLTALSELPPAPTARVLEDLEELADEWHRSKYPQFRDIEQYPEGIFSSDFESEVADLATFARHAINNGYLSPKPQVSVDEIVALMDEVSGKIGGTRLLAPEGEHEKKMADIALPMLRARLTKLMDR